MSYSVTQNTAFLTAASVLQKVISFGYFTLIARFIGVGNTGAYFLAITFTTIFTVVADFGLGPVLTREAAKYPENSEKYVNTLLWTKIIFGLGAYALVIIFVNLLNYDAPVKTLVYLSGVTMFFDNLQSVFYSVFRAMKNLIYESIGIISSQFLTLVIGTTALLLRAPMIWLIAAYTIPSALNVAYAAYFLRRRYNLTYRLVWDKVIFRSFITIAVPFAIAGILGRLYSYTDSILMSKILTHEHVGLWSVAYKITFAFGFIPAALSASVYPAMSSLMLSDASKVGALFENSWSYLFMIVAPLAAGLAAVAKPVITTLYGQAYLPSVPVLQLLLISLIFGYLSFVTGALLNATNHQKIQTMLLACALAASIILNFLLLPIIDIQGAALAAIIGNGILCCGGFYFARRYIPINAGKLIKDFLRSGIPALIMGISGYFLSQYIHFTAVIVLCAALYGVLLFVSGALSRTMLTEMVQKVRF